MIKIFQLFMIANLFICINLSAQERGTFVDSRDGKTYTFFKIGNQTWMGENLNYRTESGSSCWDGNGSWTDLKGNCDNVGRYYNWESAKIACPSGWHLPNKSEWEQLAADSISGRMLKNFGEGVMSITKQEDSWGNAWWDSLSLGEENEAAEYWEMNGSDLTLDSRFSNKTDSWNVRCIKD